MICCKIVTNLQADGVNYVGLIDSLMKLGALYIDGINNALYFSDVEGSVTDKKIKSVLKKNGYDNFFINIYNKDNEPKEDDQATIWLTNELIKMNYHQYEQQSQETFRNISKGLKQLSNEFDKAMKDIENTKSDM